ncbi:cation:proton antiporter [Candidatus Auribacterota bacterium]
MQVLIIIAFIAVVLAAARIGGAFARKYNQLSILGELVVGIVLGIVITHGPLVFFRGVVDTDVFRFICNAGIFFLMLMAGMHLDIKQLLRMTGKGSLIALGGLVLSLYFGYKLGQHFLPDSEYKLIQSFFLGVVLSITAIPSLSRVLYEIGMLRTKFGHTIINAAIADDIFGMLTLAVLMNMITSHKGVYGADFVLLAVQVVAFFAFLVATGFYIIRFIGKKLERLKARWIQYAAAVAVVLLVTGAAEYSGMHFLIGALVAGMFLRDDIFNKEVMHDMKERVTWVTLAFLAPIFFVSIGIQVDLTALTAAPVFVLFMIGAAILGKVLGAGVCARMTGFSARESLAVGTGMNGRGAVELFVAAVAIDAGLFAKPVDTPELVNIVFSSVIIMTIVTTVLVSIGMKPLLKGTSSEN